MKSGILAVLFLSIAVCMAWAAPAGEESTAAATVAAPDDIWAKYDPSITVTSVFSLSAFIEDALNEKPDVMEDNVWTRGYRDDLGIEIELLWTVPGAQYDEKLSLAIAANDLPDVIPTNAIQFKLLVDSGVAMDITSLFEAYASPLTRKMQELDKPRIHFPVHGRRQAVCAAPDLRQRGQQPAPLDPPGTGSGPWTGKRRRRSMSWCSSPKRSSTKTLTATERTTRWGWASSRTCSAPGSLT